MVDSRFTSVVILVDQSAHVLGAERAMESFLEHLLDELSAVDSFVAVSVVYSGERPELVGLWSEPRNVKIHIDPSGGSMVRDSLAFAVYQMRAKIAELPEHARPSSNYLIVCSAGVDDLSKEFDSELTDYLIRHCEDVLGWSFRFFGASLKNFARNSAQMGTTAPS